MQLWRLQPVKGVRLTLVVNCADRKIHCFPCLSRAQVCYKSSPIRVFLEPAFLHVPFPAVPSQTQGCWGGESEVSQGNQGFLWVCVLLGLGVGGGLSQGKSLSMTWGQCQAFDVTGPYGRERSLSGEALSRRPEGEGSNTCSSPFNPNLFSLDRVPCFVLPPAEWLFASIKLYLYYRDLGLYI